jgi:hypothetical protein
MSEIFLDERAFQFRCEIRDAIVLIQILSRISVKGMHPMTVGNVGVMKKSFNYERGKAFIGGRRVLLLHKGLKKALALGKELIESRHCVSTKGAKRVGSRSGFNFSRDPLTFRSLRPL